MAPGEDARTEAEICQIDPSSPEARYCLDAYAAELDARFPEGYERSNLIHPAVLDSEGGCFLIARRDSEVAGCGVLRPLGSSCGEVKHLWVDPAHRGQGLSRRLLSALEAAARAKGYTTVRLDTHTSLTEAVQLYRSTGYHEIPPYGSNPHAGHWFEKSI